MHRICDHRECMVEGATERTKGFSIITFESIVFVFVSVGICTGVSVNVGVGTVENRVPSA